MKSTIDYDAYFLSYSGTRLPFKLVGQLELADIANRNTFFGACMDEDGRTTLIHKVVYGEIELEHRYGYHADGSIAWAEILDDEGERQQLTFAAAT